VGADPFLPEERWLNRDEFSVRRRIIPTTTPRLPAPIQPRNLPSICEGAHPWPLQWGGKDIREGHFYAHKIINAGAQKRLENAGLRLAETARAQGAEIRCTATVTRYKQANLLERATYKFEAVFKVGDPQPLGEITIAQNLSFEQRRALVEGTLISDAITADTVLEYRWNGKVVKIDPKKLFRISTSDVFASLTKLGDFVHGLKRTSRERRTPRGRQIQKAERARIAQADKEASARATPPDSPHLTKNNGVEGRSVESGRPTATQRGTGRRIPGTIRSVANVAGGTALGWLSQQNLDSDVRERREKTGLASPTQDYDADETPILKFGRFWTGQKGETSLWDRLDMPRFREYLREQAAGARPGDELEVMLPIRLKGLKYRMGVPYYAYKGVRIIYRKQRYNPRTPGHRKWLDVHYVDDWPPDAAVGQNVRYLDHIIDPNRSDSEIDELLGIVRPSPARL
jgi:hypothetical protein